MFQALIRWSMDHAKTVVIAAALVLGLAAWLIPGMPVDVFPELNAPTVVVLTEAGGLAADEVEAQVTIPIESALAGVPGLRRLRSSSAMSLSIVWAEFGWGEDVYRARAQIGERLSAVRENLPLDTHAELAPVSSITGEIMLLSVAAKDDTVSPLALRAFAEYDLRNKLLAVPGVSQVVAIGGALPEYQVHARQDRLLLYGLTVEDLAKAAAGAHSTASAGYLPNVQGRELAVRQAAAVRGVDDIKRTLVAWKDGAPVTIGDVAEVSMGAAPARGTATEGARSAVILSVQKAPSTNTLALTAALDVAIDKIALPTGMTLNRHVFRQADFIGHSITNLTHVLRDAVIIVAVVLILFLLNVRTTIITLTALPLSLAVGMLALGWLDLSINVMTLGGLAVAIGGLVDDAIIDVENVYRRLGENGALPPDQRRPSLAVIYDASNEIRGAMVFATVIIVLVFVPLLFLQGIEGRFFRPLGLAYIVSTLASLVVALTVTPALCGMMLGRGKAAAAAIAHHDGFLVRWLKAAYIPVLRWSLRHRLVVLGTAVLMTIASLWLGSSFGSSFLPAFKEGTYTVFIMTPPGTSLIESDRLARGVEQQLIAIEGVRSVARRTGRAERDEHAEPVSSSEIEVTVKPESDPEVVRDGIDRVLAAVPGITTMIGQPIEHRLSHILSGTPSAIAINIYGEDLDQLRATVKQVEVAVKGVAGTRDVTANREIMVATLPVRYRHADLARAGLTPAGAATQVRQAISGEPVAVISEGVRRYDLMVRLHPQDRERPEQLGELVLRGSAGALVRLREVADIGEEKASYLIAHESGSRKALVSCNVATGENLGHLVAKVQAAVDPIVKGAGLSVHYGGQFEAQQEASRTIFAMGAGVIVVIFLLIAAATGSPISAAIVLVNLPLSLIGGIVAIFIAESVHPVSNALALVGIGGRYIAPVVSIASLVGFITLFGIAVRNGILLVNQYHARLAGGEPLAEALVHGSVDRLVAILMTALCAALGLVPLAYTAGQPGSEILAPLAVVVLGGLITSTTLNLVVVPAAYALVYSRRRPVVTNPPPPSGSASQQGISP